MDSIQEIWGRHSKGITAVTLMIGVLSLGFVASSFGNSSAGGMERQAADFNGGSPTTSASGSLELSKDMPGPEPGGDGTSSSADRKRIESIYMDYEAPDVEEAVQDSKQMADKLGGYSEAENFNRHNGESASVTLRVPKDNVSNFMEEASSKGDWKLQSKDRNVDDVTDRYQELELELKNKRQELERLETLMNRTDEVDSLIKIQERMSELRSRIQYLDNQLTDIDQQVEFTKIEITFEEPEPITAEFNIRESVKDGYQGVFRSMNYIIVGSGYLLPFGVIYLIYRVIKRYRDE